jgi:hypothetical protein
MTLLILYLHIHFQFIIPPILSILFLNNQSKLSIFKHRGKTFYFFVCSLCPIYQPSVHVECHHFVISHSFLLPLVAMCSLSVPDHSSMFLFIFINIFKLYCPKYWCFCLLHHLLLTHMTILTTSSLLYCCHLFQCVTLCFLSDPIFLQLSF